jgi:hypothetical protein
MAYESFPSKGKTQNSDEFVITVREVDAATGDVTEPIDFGARKITILRFKSEPLSGTAVPGATVQPLLSHDGTSTTGNNVEFETTADTAVDEINGSGGWKVETNSKNQLFLHSRVSDLTADHVIETKIYCKFGW